MVKTFKRFCKSYWQDLGAILILALLVFAFFSRLFFPEPAIFAIPDHGLSDIWHFNYPLKEFLSRSLKTNTLPLWTNLLGTGFPPLAQGEIGTFNIVNLILYKFFPTWLAFNLNYVLSFLLISIGAYLYARYLRLNLIPSLFAASVFTFSGFFIAQVNHLSHIQTASYLPLLFLLVELVLQKPNLKGVLLFSLILTQQIFSGYYQYVFISLFTLSLYIFLRVWFNPLKKRVRINILTYFSIGALLGIILSSIQLLPSFEFFLNSVRKDVSPRILAVDLTWRHLLLLINPHAAGNPITGEYLHEKGGYWEVSSYIGIIPVLLTVFSFLLLKNKKWGSLTKLYFSILLISFLLFLGRESPLYLIHSIPPFNYFRIPSRFILIVLWSIAILSAIKLNNLPKLFGEKSKIITSVTVLILSLIPLLDFAHKYQAVFPYEEIFKETEMPKGLQLESQDKRIFSFLGQIPWSEYFHRSGWQNLAPYLYFRNNLDANYSLVFNYPHGDIYTGTPLKRQNYLMFLTQERLLSKQSLLEVVKIDNSSLKFLSIMAVEKIISPFQLENAKLEKTYETQENPERFSSYKIYENKSVLPRARMVYKYKKVETVEEMERTLLSEDFKPENEVVLEKEVHYDNTNYCSITDLSNSNCFSEVNWLKDEDQEIELEVETEKDGFLVLADTYYPGWKAFVDGKETEIK